MDDASIREIVEELRPLLNRRSPGKIFQTGPAAFAIDFGLRDQGYLFLSVEPAEPRLYLIQRRVRDLEKQSVPLNQFGLTLRKELSQTQIGSIAKDELDRIVRFAFAGIDELGNPKSRILLAQLTGRSANVFLIDDGKRIIQSARAIDILGQRVGEIYEPPPPAGESSSPRQSKLLKQIHSGEFSSPSEAADTWFTSLLHERNIAAQAAAARAALRKKIAQQQKLRQQLQRDLAGHAEAASHKRVGDLLLANLSTAKRHGNRLRLIDYFADDGATVEIELDTSVSLQEEASRRFKSYSRSKRATAQINQRIMAVENRLRELKLEQESLERALSKGAVLPSSAASSSSPGPAASETRKTARIPGTRRYVSADDFDILVGRAAGDNDHLTFKVAKPNDLWLHVADYGGSHVVVRNATRKPVPHRTLVEAAQLAAWFSQGKKDAKVDVHYTERKFVSRIKGGKPGLVRLQRFKNITVEPREAGTRE